MLLFLMVIKCVSVYRNTLSDQISRSILPWMQEVSNNPKLLKHIFGCKEKEFKRLYGEFALNKTKSEAIIGQHNEYFNVRI